jgi:hypothetical protein
MSSVNLETLLYDEIDTEFDKLSSLEPGTEQHKAAADTLAKLMDKAIELDRVESERMDKEATRKSEQLLKEQQLKDEKKDRFVKNIIGAAGVVLPLIVTIWGTKVSLNFEKEGTFTTIMGRGFIQKLLPKK